MLNEINTQIQWPSIRIDSSRCYSNVNINFEDAERCRGFQCVPYLAISSNITGGMNNANRIVLIGKIFDNYKGIRAYSENRLVQFWFSYFIWKQVNRSLGL